MHVNPVARAYAEALLAIATERGQAQAVGADLADVAALLAAEADVRQFLATPTLAAAVQKRALEQALGGRVQRVLVDFLCLLVDKGRIGALDAIAAAYGELADVAAGRIRVHVASATPLAEANVRILIDMARERLQAECMLETAVQPELLGGLVVTVGDTIYDGSLRGRLQRLRNTLMRSSGYEN